MEGRKVIGEAKKFDQGKPDLSLIPRYPLEEVAKVLMFGANLYGRYNWRKGFNWSRVIAATQRHINAFNDGEDVASDSDLSHLAHAICNLMFLLQYSIEHKELDDRYKSDQEQIEERVGRVERTVEECESAGKEFETSTVAERKTCSSL